MAQRQFNDTFVQLFNEDLSQRLGCNFTMQTLTSTRFVLPLVAVSVLHQLRNQLGRPTVALFALQAGVHCRERFTAAVHVRQSCPTRLPGGECVNGTEGCRSSRRLPHAE